MKVGNLDGRLILIGDDGAYVDVAEGSAGRFGHDPTAVYDRWDEFLEWAATVDFSPENRVDTGQLSPPVPTPRQIFAIGLNYSDHASESGFAVPDQPTVFTKFVSCLASPHCDVTLPGDGNTDWEVELVAVIGRKGTDIDESDAWSHIAGLTVGQDISERLTQSAGPAPQFSLGKSFPGFGPIGPWVVPVAEFSDPDDLELGCSINGTEMQRGRTKDLVFSVPALVSKLSRIVTLYPGDLIFTGTPAGVGLGRNPQVYLQEGDELVSWVEGIGEIRQRFVSAAARGENAA
ncbi:fumarylacetoacetate (FAA) hydrolase family protein [Mycolicibacterium canariasense]|uniref:Fumarylacetoacetate (FAA) hydrolase family protein n=1 Tax=Mycolicibacterium canariasense TaxID=228230 RepID=A0A100WIC3_MYCCR|nr:fumarylacetoacetate hydrolase family protein [Mycolicibacterium canariasense]MCV7211804.1 fumarylacetoacetate hydrolase family protein [Mycolicibacterium canariasense]ORV08131.1 fumarylacetoacetate hydrolase [Mycolicibacterium canariasense]GAS98333.1 fumarylacetoacetate (FAA) hydrolase family protein [Mycolicibacterium canariasense]